MKCNLLKELTDEHNEWKVMVRIIRLWEATNFKNNELISLDMLVIDKEGNDIHVVIRKNLVQKFRPMIHEGDVYIISKFNVTKGSVTYKPSRNELKIMFLLTTSVDNGIECNIPRYKFTFSDYTELTSRVNDNVYLSDVIGKVLAVGSVETVQVGSSSVVRRNIEIVLAEGAKIKVTLWGKPASEVDKDLLLSGVGPFFMAITSTTVKTFRGEYSISSTSATKVYVNPEIPEKDTFQHSDFNLIGNKIQEIPAHQKNEKTIDEMKSHNKKTIAEIKKLEWDSEKKEIICTCIAEIYEIETTFGWCYTSCQLCRKKVTPRGTSLWCERCQLEPRFPIQRYKVQVQVKDSTGSASFVLFDKDCEQMFGKTARELIMIDGFDPSEIPPVMNNIVGKTYIFQLKVDDYNLNYGWDNYTVTRIFNEDDTATPNSHVLQDTLASSGKMTSILKRNSAQPSGLNVTEEKRKCTTNITIPTQEDGDDAITLQDYQEDGFVKETSAKGKRRKLILRGSP